MSFRISDFGFRLFATIATTMLFAEPSYSAEKQNRKESAAPKFAATINGHAVNAEFIFGKFDPKKRTVTKRNATTDAGERYEEILVNVKRVLGTDNTDPTPGHGDSHPFATIESISLRWDGKSVTVEQSLFDHIVLPHRNTNLHDGNQPDVMFIPDPAGDALVIVMTVGDGGGTNRIVWLLRKDGKHRILNNGFLELSN